MLREPQGSFRGDRWVPSDQVYLILSQHLCIFFSLGKQIHIYQKYQEKHLLESSLLIRRKILSSCQYLTGSCRFPSMYRTRCLFSHQPASHIHLTIVIYAFINSPTHHHAHQSLSLSLHTHVHIHIHLSFFLCLLIFFSPSVLGIELMHASQALYHGATELSLEIFNLFIYLLRQYLTLQPWLGWHLL